MKKIFIILVALLLECGYSLYSQEYYQISSYTDTLCYKKKFETSWTDVTYDTQHTIKLVREDSVNVKGKLTIYKCDDKEKRKELLVAYKGKWNIEKILSGQAISDKPNCSLPGVVIKSGSSMVLSPISIDFISEKGVVENFVNGTKLKSVCITNISDDVLYAHIFYSDNEINAIPFDYLADVCKLNPRMLNMFYFKNPIEVDNNRDTLTIYVIYSKISTSKFEIQKNLDKYKESEDVFKLTNLFKKVTESTDYKYVYKEIDFN